MDKKSLGRRINRARKDKGLTSEGLAELCYINAAYLRQIEAGRKIPSLPVFASICQALSVSPNYLLSDILEGIEGQDMETLTELWKEATPSEIRKITNMIRSALE